MEKKRSHWSWIPSLYFTEGLPYVMVMTISVIMYKRLGISNTDIALYTSWLYLPWVIKPFWSPFIDLAQTKRWWTVAMQFLLVLAFACIAFTIPTSFFFRATLAFFWLVAFTSATHDIAADGYYMMALDESDQSLYVGIRSTFYRLATVVGQGLLVIMAGLLETGTGLEPASLEIEASPHYTNMLTLPETTRPTDSDNTLHFVFTSPVVKAGTVLRDRDAAAKVDALAADIKAQNIANGFQPSDNKEARKTETSTSWGESILERFTVWKDCQADCFTNWVRTNFGEEHRNAPNATSNVVAVGVRLSHQPADGKTHVLNMVFKKGDRSISIEDKALSTRFEFDKDNWDKTAWMMFRINPNIKAKTGATFEGISGNIPLAWMSVFAFLSVFFLIMSIYHNRMLPRPAKDHAVADLSANNIARKFFETFKSFFTKKGIFPALLFMLLFRLPEAQLVKMLNPFLLDSIDKGGLGLTTGQVGMVYGTIGIIGLTLGGILGGIVVAHGGLRKWIWPMVMAITLPDLAYVYLSYAQPESLSVINLCIFIEQFGYGFGFTAYMLYMMYFSEGPNQTSHYAICTGFMALGMMLPGMMAGWLEETIGYRHFFVWAMICCAATFIVTYFVGKSIDPRYGQKEKSKDAA